MTLITATAAAGIQGVLFLGEMFLNIMKCRNGEQSCKECASKILLAFGKHFSMVLVGALVLGAGVLIAGLCPPLWVLIITVVISLAVGISSGVLITKLAKKIERFIESKFCMDTIKRFISKHLQIIDVEACTKEYALNQFINEIMHYSNGRIGQKKSSGKKRAKILMAYELCSNFIIYKQI